MLLVACYRCLIDQLSALTWYHRKWSTEGQPRYPEEEACGVTVSPGPVPAPGALFFSANASGLATVRHLFTFLFASFRKDQMASSSFENIVADEIRTANVGRRGRDDQNDGLIYLGEMIHPIMVTHLLGPALKKLFHCV